MKIVQAVFLLEDACLYAYGHLVASQGVPGPVDGPLTRLFLEGLRRDLAGHVHRGYPNVAEYPLHDGTDGLYLDVVEGTYCDILGREGTVAGVSALEYRTCAYLGTVLRHDQGDDAELQRLHPS